MSKKHFEWAARYVRDERTNYGDDNAKALERAFVAMFRAFGPRFDESRFRAACQVRD